jgi:DNA-binding MarR family transcriptional regulator
MSTMSEPVALEDLDLSLAAMLAGLAMAEAVERRVAAAGFDDARLAHGFLFQHLLREPLTVGALARAMGVTQQRASKAASELEELGYVRRDVDPSDARVRRLVLTERGHGAVGAAREARAELVAELRERFGDRRVSAAERLLRDVLAEMGAAETVRARRVRLPS